MNRVLILGGNGILGSEVVRQLNLRNIEFLSPSSSDLDIRNNQMLVKSTRDFKPSWIVNCAAWTNVDGAEVSFEAALEINEQGVQNIAAVAKEFGSQVIHISTDYVFDGTSSQPYDERMPVNPINKYGDTKLRGEVALINVIPMGSYIIRTSWLYGISGKNFVKTMAAKALRNEPARVVDDQIGTPTSARDLAQGILAIIDNSPNPGIYNFSNKGLCSWFDLACTIYRIVGKDYKLVEAIDSNSLNFIARRPQYSVLNKEKWESAGLTLIPDWQNSLEVLLPEIIKEIKISEMQ